MWFQLPPHMVFHVANAWEEADGSVKASDRVCVCCVCVIWPYAALMHIPSLVAFVTLTHSVLTCKRAHTLVPPCTGNTPCIAPPPNHNGVAAPQIFVCHQQQISLNLDTRSSGAIPPEEHPRLAVITLDPSVEASAAGGERVGSLRMLTAVPGDFPTINTSYVGRKYVRKGLVHTA